MNILTEIIGILFVGAVVYVLIHTATKGLNPSLPSMGRGRRAKPGGDAIISWLEKLLISLARGLWKMFWAIVSAPFRRP